MTYKLNPELKKIQSPITLAFPDGSSSEYQSGTDVTSAVFEKRYIVASLRAIENSIEIRLEEASVNEINWIGEEAVSFF